MTDRTDADLVNMAFDLIEQSPLSSTDNPIGEIEERAVRLLPEAVDQTLRRAQWSAARSVAILPAITLIDDYYPTVIQLPPDCVLVWTVGGQASGWEMRHGLGAGRVGTNAAAPVTVVYNRRLQAGEMPVELALLTAANLAVMLMNRPSLKLSAAKQQVLRQIRDERERAAVDVMASMGGQRQVYRSRAIDALYGVSAPDTLIHPPAGGRNPVVVEGGCGNDYGDFTSPISGECDGGDFTP